MFLQALKITFNFVQTYFVLSLIDLGIWLRILSIKFNRFRERRSNRMHLELNILMGKTQVFVKLRFLSLIILEKPDFELVLTILGNLISQVFACLNQSVNIIIRNTLMQ